MRIALDYDDTFTRDPTLWMGFLTMARARKHDVRIVTFRNAKGNNDDILNSFKGLVPVLYTGGVRKRQYCYEQGFMVDVWIDDMPEIIVEDHHAENYPVNLIKIANED